MLAISLTSTLTSKVHNDFYLPKVCDKVKKHVAWGSDNFFELVDHHYSRKLDFEFLKKEVLHFFFFKLNPQGAAPTLCLTRLINQVSSMQCNTNSIHLHWHFLLTPTHTDICKHIFHASNKLRIHIIWLFFFNRHHQT